jgi:hypothetical protein
VTGVSRFVEQRECSLSTLIGSKQHSPVDHHATSADLMSLGVCLAAYCGLQVASAYIQNQKWFQKQKSRGGVSLFHRKLGTRPYFHGYLCIDFFSRIGGAEEEA